MSSALALIAKHTTAIGDRCLLEQTTMSALKRTWSPLFLPLRCTRFRNPMQFRMFPSQARLPAFFFTQKNFRYGIVQIHIIVFLIGIFHILYTASAFFISYQGIKRWKAWEKEFNPAGDSTSDVRKIDKVTVRKSPRERQLWRARLPFFFSGNKKKDLS